MHFNQRFRQQESPRHWRLALASTIVLIVGGCGAEGAEPGEGTGGAGGAAGSAGSSAADARDIAEVLPRLPSDDDRRFVMAPPANAQTCTADGQCATGYCVDGFCCNTQCTNECMACSAAKKGSGVDGLCGSIKYDTDPDNECLYGACNGKNRCKTYNGVPCATATECLSNYCVDGFCCNNICMGECQACSMAKKGGGYNGACGPIAYNTDPDHECQGSLCTGWGPCNLRTEPTLVNGSVCISGAQCLSGYCADGICCDSWCLGTCQACTAAKKGSGIDGTCGPIAPNTDPEGECLGGTCSGASACTQSNGTPCTNNTQCSSGYCIDDVCCDNLCDGSCNACSAGRKGQGNDGTCGPIAAGRDLQNECNPGECNGSGACNQPQSPQVNGTACVSSGQCASNHCVDGLCCDTACTSTCQACSAAKKGAGADGTCGNIGSELDPDNECNGGRCDGQGACRYYNGVPCSSAGQCFSNYCVDGFCCGNICTGSCKACSRAKKGTGYDGVCGFVATNTDPDDECTLMCDGSGACQKLPNGSTCTSPSECASGSCVNGVCCEGVSCTGSCSTGFHPCGDHCASDSSVTECGTACAMCPVPPDGTAICINGSCGFTCNAGYEIFGNTCSALPPRPIGPLSGSIVTSQSPTLRWTLPSGVSSAHVDVCADRACTNIRWSADVMGTSISTGTLPVGTSYWRVFGIGSGGPGTHASVTWELFVPGPHTTPSGGSWGPIRDYNGDGFADGVVLPNGDHLQVFHGSANGLASQPARTYWTGNIYWSYLSGDVNGDGFVDLVTSGDFDSTYVYNGGPSGLPATSSSNAWISNPDFHAHGVGDLNGDGYADVILGNSRSQIQIFNGSSSGIRMPSAIINSPDTSNSFGARSNMYSHWVNVAVSDLNRDGYADLVIPSPTAASNVGVVYLYLGSSSGLPATPSATINNPTGEQNKFGAVVVSAGDVNGDGHPDVHIGGIAESGCTACGKSFVFYGSPSGLGSNTLIPAPIANEIFGGRASSAIDVNADGYSDLMIGCSSATTPILLFMGGPNGIATSPATSISVGQSATGFGDDNGDGFSDVFTGSGTNIFVLRGAAAGLSPTPAETIAVNAGVWHFMPL